MNAEADDTIYYIVASNIVVLPSTAGIRREEVVQVAYLMTGLKCDYVIQILFIIFLIKEIRAD